MCYPPPDTYNIDEVFIRYDDSHFELVYNPKEGPGFVFKHENQQRKTGNQQRVKQQVRLKGDY